MGIVTVRPNGTHSDAGGNVIIDSTIHGATNDNNDGTYVFCNGEFQVHLDNIGLAGNQRILQNRLRCRIANYNGAFNSDTWLEVHDLSAARGEIYYNGHNEGMEERAGGWYQSSPVGSEWSLTNANGARIRVVKGGGAGTSALIGELYLDFDIRTQPTVSNVGPTGTNPGTTRTPSASWTFGDPDGIQGQFGYHVKVFTSAQGDPENAGGAVFNSGVVQSGNQSATISPALADGTYYVYVKVSKDFRGGHWFSGWSGSSFTITDSPGIPTGITPTNGATVTTSKPVLGGTVVASQLNTPARLEWFVSSDAAGLENVRNIVEGAGDNRVSGATTEAWPGAVARLPQRSPNLLSVNQSNVETNTTGFVVNANCTIARSTAQKAEGAASLALTSVAAGNMSAALMTTLADGRTGIACAPSAAMSALATFRAATVGRTCRVDLQFYNAAGTLIGGTLTGSTIVDSTGGFTQATVQGTSPATAAFCALVPVVLSTAAGGEVHYVDKFQIATGTDTTWEVAGPYTWHLWARAIDNTGELGAWSGLQTFTVNHPPSPANFVPTGDATLNYGVSGTTLFDWVFTDPATEGDTQSAYQVEISRNDTQAIVQDTNKVVSTDTSYTYNIPVGQKDQPLRWRVRLWDSDDNVGTYSAYQLFRVSDIPQVNITFPADASIIDQARPTITWTTTLTGGRTQVSYRVRINKVGQPLGSTYDFSGSGANLSHQPPTNILENNTSYEVRVDATDSTALTNFDMNATTVVFDAPRPVAFTVNADSYNNNGYVLVSFDDSVKDAAWTNYSVYRRPSGGAWELVEEITTPAATYQVKDWLAGAGTIYEYAVTQSATRFGISIESPRPADNRTPSSGFETGMAGWQFTGTGGTGQRITSDGAQGSIASIDLNDNSGTDPLRLVQTNVDDVPVSPGETVRIEVDLKVLDTNAAPTVAFVFSDGTEIETSYANATFVVNQWSHRTFQFVVPAGKVAGYVRVMPTSSTNPAAQGRALVDNIEVYGVSKFVSTEDADYWLIHPTDETLNVRLRHVTSDSFTEDYEEEVMTLIGRGRKRDIGTRLGYSGQLTAKLYDETDMTAREQRERLQAIRSSRVAVWLRSPFGDVWQVGTGGIQTNRMAGVGPRDFADVTITYTELA